MHDNIRSLVTRLGLRQSFTDECIEILRDDNQWVVLRLLGAITEHINDTLREESHDREYYVAMQAQAKELLVAIEEGFAP